MAAAQCLACQTDRQTERPPTHLPSLHLIHDLLFAYTDTQLSLHIHVTVPPQDSDSFLFICVIAGRREEDNPHMALPMHATYTQKS